MNTIMESNTKVSLSTNYGQIIVELNNKISPITSSNFINLINDGYYNDTIFHRNIHSFCVQGGGYDFNGNKKGGKPSIINESFNGLSNKKYSLAMARAGNNPNSASTEFYINTNDNLFLDKKNDSDGYGYCVFGKIIQGQEIVDKINKLPIECPEVMAVLLQAKVI